MTDIKLLTSWVILGVFLFLIGFQCEDTQYIQYEKDRFIYKDSLEVLAERLDNKIAELRNKADALEKRVQMDKETGTAVLDSLELQIKDLEILQDRFNQAIGMVSEVTIEEWEKTKTQVDNLMVEFMDEIKGVEQKYYSESLE
jgi:hypothetical protein